jgi:hypothetical protein
MTTSFSVGLAVSAIALGMLVSPADAQQQNRKQRAYAYQQNRAGTAVAPRNRSETVCWTGCGHPGSIVMGTDPDPFIRSQLLRDASRFFGGGDP